jgi:(2Fe-2S) ferredoxin
MRFIAMPEGVFYKGMSHAPAWAIIEQHHLDFWLPQDDEYYGEEDAGFESGLGLE